MSRDYYLLFSVHLVTYGYSLYTNNIILRTSIFLYVNG